VAGAWSWRREIVFDGPGDLRDDRPAALERRDRSQGMATSAVLGRRAGLGAVQSRIQPSSPSQIAPALVPENCSISSTSPFSNWIEVFSYGITYGYQRTSGCDVEIIRTTLVADDHGSRLA